MKAKEPLDHVRFCDDCLYPGDDRFIFGTVVQDVPCFRCGNDKGYHVVESKVYEPRLVGGGCPEFSTCVELVLVRPFVWDTNGYYRDLGVSTVATRGEIGEAYLAKNGDQSVRLTYVARQLLDPEVRSRYDSTPIGSIFRDDEVETWIREAKIAAIREAILKGEVTSEEVLEGEEPPDEMVLDTASPSRENGQVPPSSRRHLPNAYYAWQAPFVDDGILAIWKSLLAAAMCRRGEHRQIAVGLQGAINEPFVVLPVGYRTVVFLDYKVSPNDELAEQAVSQITR